MKILLVQNSLYYPAYGGGNKSNRLLLEELTARGHECRVVTRVSETLDAERLQTFLAELEMRNVAIHSSAGGLVVFRLNGVEVRTETSVHKVRDHLVSQIEEFRPTWTLVSTDDPLQLFLTAALEKDAARVVYLARTTLSLPFGPDSAIPSEQRTENLRRVAGVVAVSNYVKEYIERHGHIKAVSLPISLHGTGPFSNLGSFGHGFVTMVNPCGRKGIPVLASEVGGVREAMLGMDYILPVRPVERYEARMDSQMVPEALLPEQDAGPWLESLRRLLTDRDHYETLSRTAHVRCAEHLAELSIEPFEQYLVELAPTVTSESAAKASKGLLDDLSPEKRALLLKRLKDRKPEAPNQHRE